MPTNLTKTSIWSYNLFNRLFSKGFAMADKTLRRLPLRQLLANSDKVAREAAELVHTHLLPRVVDFRDLTRPIRRKSHYPTMVAFLNGLRRLNEANDQLQQLTSSLQEHLEAIREHAQRERVTRKR
jgi:hypothetical protein